MIHIKTSISKFYASWQYTYMLLNKYSALHDYMIL